ncbi:hypothetical protein PPERSA_11877 [Pseudocohnilembus persalinus]|uniref:Transmembrane protein n=1 Tax=Pseudocohnilembus persalinus TaxID=266149 RepID=A0A0V0QJT1_PSEPJ|nr:hypothetical protein PPERSA_11877 [Pseudocohnilembus persalinus]|eukprot:KRX02537.1 hypothetical protein PPERSA_11877 [Pseudocohnilembus persalinus]
MEHHKMTSEEIQEFRQNILNKTQLVALAGVTMGMMMPFGSFIYFLPLTFLPQYFAKQIPEKIMVDSKRKLKFVNSNIQLLSFGAMGLLIGTLSAKVLQLTFGIVPAIFLFQQMTLNLQKQGKLNEQSGMITILGINFFSILLSVATGGSIFLDSVGNNIFLIAFNFFICYQQQILDQMISRKYIDELEAMFSSFLLQKLAYQNMDYKQKGIILGFVIMVAILQIYIRPSKKKSEAKIIQNKQNINEITDSNVQQQPIIDKNYQQVQFQEKYNENIQQNFDQQQNQYQYDNSNQDFQNNNNQNDSYSSEFYNSTQDDGFGTNQNQRRKQDYEDSYGYQSSFDSGRDYQSSKSNVGPKF